MRASGVLLFGSVSLCCRCLGCAPGLLRRARALPLPLPLPLSVLPLVLFAPFGCPLPGVHGRASLRNGLDLKACGLSVAGVGVSTPSSRGAEVSVDPHATVASRARTTRTRRTR